MRKSHVATSESGIRNAEWGAGDARWRRGETWESSGGGGRMAGRDHVSGRKSWRIWKGTAMIEKVTFHVGG